MAQGIGQGQTKVIIKRLIEDVKGECLKRGEIVSETLVAFMIKAVVINPANNYEENRELEADDLDRIVKLCAERVTDKRSSGVDTMKMQVYFDMNYVSRGTFIKEHRDVMVETLRPVLREIIDARSRTAKELEGLYRKVTGYILANSSLGSPTDMSVIRETTAALRSVLPQAEIGSLTTLNSDQKKIQLNELSYIVSGIRLFNKKSGKGGSGIDDLPTVLSRALPKAMEKVDAQLTVVKPFCDRITAIMENDSRSGNVNRMDPKDFLGLAEAQANCRQKEQFLNLLKAAMDTSKKQVSSCMDVYNQQMEDISTIVQMRRSVATGEVYPKFREIAVSWEGLQEETIYIGMLDSIAAGLTQYGQLSMTLYPEQELLSELENLGENVLTDGERLEKTNLEEDSRICSPLGDQVKILLPDDVINFSDLKIEYKGFCAYAIAGANGLLLPGNTNIGILEYNSQYYSFSSKEAARAFSYSPRKYTYIATSLSQERPYLIPLLELHSSFSSVGDGRMVRPVQRRDFSMGTDVHAPLPSGSGIVKSYEWNEWVLRAKAIKLANIRQKVTKSSQTDESHYRCEAATQIYLPKEQWTQTRQQKHTEVPRPTVYYAGLRGTDDNMAHPAKFDLTPTIHVHEIAEDLEPRHANPMDPFPRWRSHHNDSGPDRPVYAPPEVTEEEEDERVMENMMQFYNDPGFFKMPSRKGETAVKKLDSAP